MFVPFSLTKKIQLEVLGEGRHGKSWDSSPFQRIKSSFVLNFTLFGAGPVVLYRMHFLTEFFVAF